MKRMATVRSALLLSLVCFWTRSVRPEVKTGFKTACMNRVLRLSCPVQDHSGEILWKYREYREYRNGDWQEIGSFSKNTVSLSPNISRKFNGKIQYLQNGYLRISSFAPELSGIYRCQWNNKGQILHVMLTVVAVSCEKSVCEGDSAIIECDLMKHENLLPPGLDPPRELQWNNNERRLVVLGPKMNVTYQNPNFSNIGPTQGAGALRISSANKDINGQRYTCVLHGERGVTSRRYSVVIHVQKCQKKINNTCEGDSIDLRCPYYQPLAKNTRDVRLEWYKGTNKVAILHKNKSQEKLSESLEINGTNGMVTLLSLGVFDSGIYTCKVFRDTVLLAEHNVTLNVTQCTTKPTRKASKASGEKEEEKAKEKREKIRDIILIVLFAVFVLFVLPVCLYCMVKRQRRIPDQPPMVIHEERDALMLEMLSNVP